MAFSFDPDESPRAGLRRIALHEVTAALALLHGARDGQAVHALRKHTKRLRALLRLYRPVMKSFGTENAALRRAARHLAPLRDAEVRLATFDLLAVPQAAPLRDRLVADLDALRAPDALGAALAAMEGELAAIRDRVPDWRLTRRARGFDLLQPGLAQTLALARTRMGQASDALGQRRPGQVFDAVAFHEWRKAVKHHGFQARLLQPLWPKMMAPHIAATDTLGEGLGLHNDLDMLIAGLDGAEPALAEPLALAALLRRHQLARKALRQGARLFAGSPECHIDRWAVWWALWNRA